MPYAYLEIGARLCVALDQFLCADECEALELRAALLKQVRAALSSLRLMPYAYAVCLAEECEALELRPLRLRAAETGIRHKAMRLRAAETGIRHKA
jgi:hypothetical protein